VRELRAGRLVLEPQVTAHAAEMFAVLSDSAIYEFEGAPPKSRNWLARRFAGLESRRSPDGKERWLNWVVRLPNGELAGYVQATLGTSGVAHIAYALASRYWRRGIGKASVGAMLEELAAAYGVTAFAATLKTGNHRSRALLRSLGFRGWPARVRPVPPHEADEIVWYKAVRKRKRDAAESTTRLEVPSRERAEEFLRAVRASRDLHRGWVTPPSDRASFRRFVAGARSPTRAGYFVVAVDGSLAGVINVSEIVRGYLQSAYLGYYALEPHAGRGVMRAGLRLVIEHCFDKLRLHRLEANIQPANARSIALVRGLGFRQEGFSPRYLKVCGRWRDHERWALLADDWRGRE
jgi:ribosomal-protein-alanine N-acetyltransferase